MQTQVLKLAVGGATRLYRDLGNLFVYESGVPTPTGGDTRIVVKPAGGEEIVLRPGQRFRLPPGMETVDWNVRTYDSAVALDGAIIMGSGEFDDANTLNKFTLDATFANNVSVTNTPNVVVGNTNANRVPVALDTTATQQALIMNSTAQRVPVTLDLNQTLNISGGLVAYTHSNSNHSNSVANTAISMLAAAVNTNGVVLEKFELLSMSPSGVQNFAVIAKTGTSAPTSLADGDVLFSCQFNLAGRYALDLQKDGRIKTGAGKTIWYMSTGVDGCIVRNALFTVM
jgi:hypothetical protein